MSTFYFDDEEGYQVAEDHSTEQERNPFGRRRVESYEVSNTLNPIQPSNAPSTVDQYSYNKYMKESMYQPVQPSQTGDTIIAGRDFHVSLVGEDGPDEYLSTVRAADRLTTIWEDAADIRYKLDQQYYTGKGGSYTPINFGIPKYTGDAGYPVVDPNPGNCKPGFMKDQFGRCLHVSWFNLPFAPAGNPWVDISGNSIISNGMSPINGVCPNDMFLASNNKCYFYPSPPQTLPPPPVSGVPVGTSGSSSYASAFVGMRDNMIYGKSPNGRIYNTPPPINAFYGNNTVDVQYGAGRINQVYVEKQNLIPGDRAILHTTVTLYDTNSNLGLGITVPDLNFKVVTPEIPVQHPGISEEIETNFLIPMDTEPGEYVGEIQLIQNNTKKIDSVNFVLAVD